MTAVLALGYLLHTSVKMTSVAFAIILCFGSRNQQGVQDDSADFPGAPKNQRGSHRPTDGIAWRRARGEGIPRGGARRVDFRGGRGTLLENILKTITATSLMSLSGVTMMGIVGAFDVRIRRARDRERNDDGRAMVGVQLHFWCCWLRRYSRSWRLGHNSPKRSPASSARARF